MAGIGLILKQVFGGSNPIEAIADVADRFITTKQEKLEFKQELEKIEVDAEQAAQQYITDRHKVDMASDSWLSKNVRPLTLVFLLGVITVLSLTDGNIGEFEIQPAYITLYQNMLMAVFSFYFIGRAAMHITEVIKKK